MTTSPAPAAARGGVRLAPEERFWQRYSPHHEAPLSGIGSFAIHFLLAGLLLLGGYLGWLGLRARPPRAIPVDFLAYPSGQVPGSPDLAPGGGSPFTDKSLGGEPRTEPAPATPRDRPGLPTVGPTPSGVELPEDRPFPSAEGGRLLKDLGRLRDMPTPAARADRTGPATGGKGGGGRPGATSPVGTIKVERVPRAVRWDLRFNTRDGRDYLRQLQGLGAILAIPSGPDSEYKIVRDLSHRPVQLLDEDLTQIPGIRWRDDDPHAVEGIMRALGLNVRATHFAAFFPTKVEEELARLEREYAGRAEDQIARTQFRIVWTGGRYELQVTGQEPLR